MKRMTFVDIANKYNSTIDEALKFNYLVRDSELQLEQREKLLLLKDEIKGYKYQAIERKDEFSANTFFHFQCVLNSLASILKMWVELKGQKYKEAWDLLIDAQEYLLVALRIEGNHYGIEDLQTLYENIEKIIYPGWPLYNSVGYLEKGGECSICGKQYGDCEHLEGIIYMGRLCRRINAEPITMDHIAMVESPSDKRCIIQWITTEDGRKRDYITWKLTDEKIDNPEGKGMMLGGVMLNLNMLEFD